MTPPPEDPDPKADDLIAALILAVPGALLYLAIVVWLAVAVLYGSHLLLDFWPS